MIQSSAFPRRTATIVHHRVADFESWKQVYDGFADAQREAGRRCGPIRENADDGLAARGYDRVTSSTLTEEVSLMTGTIIEEAAPKAMMAPEPGWRRFETDDLELSLPERYIGGDPRRDMRQIRQECKNLGPAFAGREKALRKLQVKQDNVEFRFIALDADAPGVEVHAMHVKLPLLKRGMTLGEYINVFLREAREAGAEVNEQSVVPHPLCAESGRLVADIRERHRFHKAGPVTGRQLSYAIKGRRAFWLLQYSVLVDDWERLLPVFEQSAATLKLKELETA